MSKSPPEDPAATAEERPVSKPKPLRSPRGMSGSRNAGYRALWRTAKPRRKRTRPLLEVPGRAEVAPGGASAEEETNDGLLPWLSETGGGLTARLLAPRGRAAGGPAAEAEDSGAEADEQALGYERDEPERLGPVVHVVVGGG